MLGYPTPTDIEIRWRKSGVGVCVIVEGETEQDDAWFYNQWFGDRAREVTFFPQNGWTAVVNAVTTLRATIGPKSVYGIIDRDFAPNIAYPPLPPDGILRTPKYTLENYLLDPDCWFQFMHPYTLRVPKPGWNTVEEVAMTIERLYRECIPLAAYNIVLRQARDIYDEEFNNLPESEKKYKEHPKALAAIGDVPTYLGQLTTKMGLSEPDDFFAKLYKMGLKEMRDDPVSNLEQVVSGKYVLNLLKERFPLRLSGQQAWDDVLGAYVDICPAPPEDLRILVDLILQDAHS